MTDIRKWLEQHGLGKYAELLLENEVGLEEAKSLLDDLTPPPS